MTCSNPTCQEQLQKPHHEMNLLRISLDLQAERYEDALASENTIIKELSRVWPRLPGLVIYYEGYFDC